MERNKKQLKDRVLIYAVVWCLSYLSSLLTLKTMNISQTLGISLTLITVAAFGVFIYTYYKSISFMDEVQIKIQMEAIVIAFSLGMILLMTLGLLDLTVKLKKEDWSYRHIVPLFVLFYFIGLIISNRKYNFENEEHN